MTVEQERMNRDSFVERRTKELDDLSVIRRMMQKGYDIDVIAEITDRELSVVKSYMSSLNECGPTAEINEVYNYIHRNDGYEKI